MNIPSGVIFIWAGTNATIPSGWERVTALDSKFPKGTANATNPNQTGGAATHSHSASASHSHTDTHTHTLSLGYNVGITENEEDKSTLERHSHSAVTSGACSGGGLSDVVATYASYSNNPPYRTVIFITPTSGVATIPNEIVYLYDAGDSFTNHYVCDGSNSTPNLLDKYLLGASTGSDGGSTGGTTTNVHNLTHTHTVASHTHGTFNSGSASSSFMVDVWGGNPQGGAIPANHLHSLTPSSATATVSSAVIQLTPSETVEPAYTKLMPVQNRSGGNSIRMGIIGMWLGTLANIPGNFTLCDGTNGTTDMRGRHLKLTTSVGGVGVTGGSNTHTHASQSHTHSAGATHTHGHAEVNHLSWPGGAGPADTGGTGYKATSKYDTHAVTTSSVSSSYSSASTSASSSSNEPEYVTVAFIKLTSFALSVSDSVSISETVNTEQAHNFGVSEEVTVSEYVDETIREGVNISIWRENVTVSEHVEFPGDRDAYGIEERTTVTEHIGIKILSDTDSSYKPTMKVEY